MNYVFELGRLADEPKLAVSRSGREYASFHLSVDREYSRRDRRGHTRTHDVFNCVAWGKLARAIKRHLTKGSLTMVIGKLEAFAYQDSNTKIWRKIYTIRVINAQIFDWRTNPTAVDKQRENDKFDALFNDLNDIHFDADGEPLDTPKPKKKAGVPDIDIDSSKFAGTSDDPYMPSDYDYAVELGEIGTTLSDFDEEFDAREKETQENDL